MEATEVSFNRWLGTMEETQWNIIHSWKGRNCCHTTRTHLSERTKLHEDKHDPKVLGAVTSTETQSGTVAVRAWARQKQETATQGRSTGSVRWKCSGNIVQKQCECTDHHRNVPFTLLKKVNLIYILLSQLKIKIFKTLRQFLNTEHKMQWS